MTDVDDVEPLSPELALIDPELRERALTAEAVTVVPLRVVEPPPSAAVPEPEPLPLVPEPVAPAPAPPPARVEPAPVFAAEPRRRRPRSTFVLGAAAGLVLAGAAVAVLAVFSVAPFDRHDRSAGGSTPAQTGRIGQPAQSTPATTTPPATTTQPATTAPPAAPATTTHAAPATTRRPRSTPGTTTSPAQPPKTLKFAWAPVQGASSYVFAVYLQSRRVLVAHTKVPAIQIRVAAHAGPRALSPGTYNWYVWPVRNGRQDVIAVVRARLVVRSVTPAATASAAAAPHPERKVVPSFT